MNKDQLITKFVLSNFRNITTDLSPLTRFTPSAILIPLVERDGQINIILTKRTSHLRHHPNQISFPGGKVDQGDCSLKYTALRENFEELGINHSQVSVFGNLPNLQTITGFDIKPFIGFVDPSATFIPNKEEVSDVIELPLFDVLHSSDHFTLRFERNNKNHTVYFKPTGGWPIWGATAAIIEQLRLAFH